jgi:hypothetical protein
MKMNTKASGKGIEVGPRALPVPAHTPPASKVTPLMPKAKTSSKPGLIMAARVAAEAGMTAHRSHRAATLIKKKVKFSSYIRIFRVEQLQSHI